MSTDLDTSTIPAGERRAIRANVRMQYKCLRNEIDSRVAQLLAEGEERLRLRFAADDKALKDLNREIAKVVARAQKRIDELIERSGIEPETYYNSRPGQVRVDHISRRGDGGRKRLRDEFNRAIANRAKQARLDLDRQEADALRVLIADDVKSEVGKAYLRSIPSVTELLPSAALVEVESKFKAEHGDE